MPVSVKVVWTDVATKQVQEKLPRFLSAVGSEYTNSVKRAMRASPRGGENVNSRGQKRSAPGEPPAPDTGDLIRSVRFQVVKVAGRYFVQCGSSLKKAVFLEYGAARGRIMQARDDTGKFIKGKTMSWILYPRPVWGPELLKMRAKIPTIVAKLGWKKKRK